MAEEISNDEKMRTFIMALLDEFYPECGDIDGGTFQDLAEKHGILIPEIKYQPCGEFCKCNEVVYDEEWQDGVTCYHAAEWLLSRPTPHALDGAKAAATLSGLYNCEVCGQEKCAQPGICEDCLTPPADEEIKSWDVEETPRQ